MQSRSISDSIHERIHPIILQVLKATPHIVENYSAVGGGEFDKLSAKQVVDAYSITCVRLRAHGHARLRA